MLQWSYNTWINMLYTLGFISGHISWYPVYSCFFTYVKKNLSSLVFWPQKTRNCRDRQTYHITKGDQHLSLTKEPENTGYKSSSTEPQSHRAAEPGTGRAGGAAPRASPSSEVTWIIWYYSNVWVTKEKLSCLTYCLTWDRYTMHLKLHLLK